MPRKPQPWFRFYVEAVNSDRKIRRLDVKYRWLWVAVLACARHSPVPGALMVTEGDPMTLRDLADFAGMKPGDVKAGMTQLEMAGLVAIGDRNEWFVPRWADRQYEGDYRNALGQPQRDRILARDNFACVECESVVDLHVDHILPVAEGGSNDDDNLQTLCRPCHKRKGDRDRQRRYRHGGSARQARDTGVTVTPPENREQRTDTSSSSVVTHDPPGEPVDDDRIGQAMRTLAERDLERRESEHGRVGDRERWLVAATERRLRVHAPRLDALRSAGQLAGLSASELVDVLERPKVVVGASTTADGRTFAPGSGYLADWSA